jgi:hypothetical protein
MKKWKLGLVVLFVVIVSLLGCEMFIMLNSPEAVVSKLEYYFNNNDYARLKSISEGTFLDQIKFAEISYNENCINGTNKLNCFSNLSIAIENIEYANSSYAIVQVNVKVNYPDRDGIGSIYNLHLSRTGFGWSIFDMKSQSKWGEYLFPYEA